jgi:hypothetical protein
MELVGLGYTSWFVYRYLLFKVCKHCSNSSSKLVAAAAFAAEFRGKVDR